MVKTYQKGKGVKLSENFKSTEFDCHGNGCCSTTLIDDDLVKYVQKIRDHFGKPITVTSGYRCPTHNKNIGGATGSRHSKGQAADIVVSGVAPAEVAKYAESIGIKGIGLYETNKDGHFTHVDTRTTKSFWYGQNEVYRSTFGGTPIQEESEEKEIDTSKVNTAAADPEVIWKFLKAKGLNEFGIAGLMGNLNAESALRPTNLQNTYETKLGMSDAEYTAAVDAGTYTNFVKDSAGYGLAQWTYHTRKKAMLDFHKKAGKSIGDLNTQLEFLVHELTTNYSNSVWEVLKNATSVLEASNAVLMKFERPANMGTAVQNQRAKFGQIYYDKYAINNEENETMPEVEEIKTTFKIGDVVRLKEKATYSSGTPIPAWVIKSKLYIRDIRSNGDYIISTKQTGPITGVVKPDMVISYTATIVDDGFTPYMVKITADVLNVRSGAGTKYKVNTQIRMNGIYTIVGEKDGWGRLKNGSGWICLDYTQKV